MCPAPVDSTLSVRNDLRFQPVSHDHNPADHAELTFDIDAAVECWSLHVTLTQQQYENLQNTTLWLTVFRTDNTNVTVKSVGDYMIDPLKIGSQPLSQGYVACRFPNADTEEDKVTGNWTAQINPTSGGRNTTFSDVNIDPTKILVWLSTRKLAKPSPVPDGVTYQRSLSVKFVAVCDRAERNLATARLADAIKIVTDTYKDSGIDIVPMLSPGGGKVWFEELSTTYRTDVYSADMVALMSRQARTDCVNVFAFTNLEVTNPQGAGGFAMIPGPQGFAAAQNGVFVRLRTIENATTVGTRIAHELGHYLGLTHRSVCLDRTSTSSDIGVCDTVLGDATDLRRGGLRGNLMFVETPGRRLSYAQQFMVRNAPLVKHRLLLPGTRVTELRVKVHTGRGVRSFGDVVRGDGPGTDDKVFFLIVTTYGSDVSNEISSNWNDFEPGEDWWYKLDPGGSLCEENISGFTISKKYDSSTHINLFGDDHWHLQGLVVEINGREWYSKDDIDQWLANDGKEPAEFSAPLIKP